MAEGKQPTEIEGYMFLRRGDDDIARSIGYSAPGNPRFIIFDRDAVQKFAKQDPAIRHAYEAVRVLVRIAPPKKKAKKKE
jgi:hypothetical protein